MGRKITTGRYIPHPAKRLAEKVRLVQGRRKPYPLQWEAQFLIDGKWCQPVGLGPQAVSQADAADIAGERYALRMAGVTVGPRRPNLFRDAAARTLVRLRDQEREIRLAKGHAKSHKVRQRIAALNRVLIPAMGGTPILETNDPDFLDRWVRSYRVSGRAKNAVKRIPSKSTIGNLNGAFQDVMRDARDLGWIKLKDLGRISPRDFKRGQPRPSFHPDEMKRIRDFMSDAWIEAGHTALVRSNRRMVRTMVMLIACCGIRPGVEVETITYDQCTVLKDQWGAEFVEIYVRHNQGKTAGDRRTYVEQRDIWDSQRMLVDYAKWHRPSGEKQIFARLGGRFSIFEVTFRAMLEEIGLRIDPLTLQPRTLYSLRHYYATQCLLRGDLISIVASRMGTSAAMIEAHYGHVTERLRAGDVTGSRELWDWQDESYK